MPGRTRTLLALGALLAATGCGGGGSKDTDEHADRPAHPPPGWRTFRNEAAGFTVSIPRRWTARVKSTATLIRSNDRLLVITVGADRGDQGRGTPPGEYAHRTLDALPDFEGSVTPRARRVRGSPYRSARVDALGTIRTSKRPQRIMVAAFQRPGHVEYALVAFFNPKLPTAFFEPKLRRILRSFRGQPPRST
jgi:hypothetical protein